MKIKWSLKLFVDDNDIVRCQSRLCETENLFFNYCNPTNLLHEEDFIKLQSFTKYLRQTLVFIWNSALQEKFNFSFGGDFY